MMLKLILVPTDLSHDFSHLSIDQNASPTYEGVYIKLSSSFIRKAKLSWSEGGVAKPMPPLPNLKITLPVGLTEAQLTPPEDKLLDALKTRKSTKKPEW